VVTTFPLTDTYWLDTKAHLCDRARKGTRIIAPPEFVDQLPGVFAYAAAKNLPPDFFDYAIVHKGLCNEIGRERLMFMARHFTPVFANEVFVIYSLESAHTEYRPDVHYGALLERIPDTLPLDSGDPAPDDADSDILDLEPAIGFLKTRLQPTQTLVAPLTVRKHFPTSLNETALPWISAVTVDYVVVTALSAASFPDRELAKVVENYHPVLGDNRHVIYALQRTTDKPAHDIPLARTLADSTRRGAINRAFRLYRMILLGR